MSRQFGLGEATIVRLVSSTAGKKDLGLGIARCEHAGLNNALAGFIENECFPVERNVRVDSTTQHDDACNFVG